MPAQEDQRHLDVQGRVVTLQTINGRCDPAFQVGLRSALELVKFCLQTLEFRSFGLDPLRLTSFGFSSLDF